jgi:hypothetical protein
MQYTTADVEAANRDQQAYLLVKQYVAPLRALWLCSEAKQNGHASMPTQNGLLEVSYTERYGYDVELDGQELTG